MKTKTTQADISNTKFTQKKVWEVSTAHITEEDNNTLGKQSMEDVVSYPYEFGYFIVVQSDKMTVNNPDKMSNAFIKIYNDAIESGVNLIQFDRDAGPDNPDYPTFDW